MTYSDAVIKRLTALCAERNITINKLLKLPTSKMGFAH